MEIYSLKITANNEKTAKTEIMFGIASAKAMKKDLIKLYINSEIGTSLILRILKSAKKSEKIKLYTKSDELFGETMEAEYLKNKFPELLSEENSEEYFLLKI